MKIKKFEKKMLQSYLYPFRKTDKYPVEKRADFLFYLVRKIKRGEGKTNDFVEWLRVVNNHNFN